MDIQYIYPTGNARQEKLNAQISADELGSLKGDGAFSFSDILDVINPFQQLPILGSLYRQATGDTISTGARLAGGFLLGGPIGFMVAAINAGLEGATGGDMTEHMFAMLNGNGEQQYAMRAYQNAQNLS